MRKRSSEPRASNVLTALTQTDPPNLMRRGGAGDPDRAGEVAGRDHLRREVRLLLRGLLELREPGDELLRGEGQAGERLLQLVQPDPLPARPPSRGPPPLPPAARRRPSLPRPRPSRVRGFPLLPEPCQRGLDLFPFLHESPAGLFDDPVELAPLGRREGVPGFRLRRGRPLRGRRSGPGGELDARRGGVRARRLGGQRAGEESEGTRGDSGAGGRVDPSAPAQPRAFG